LWIFCKKIKLSFTSTIRVLQRNWGFEVLFPMTSIIHKPRENVWHYCYKMLKCYSIISFSFQLSAMHSSLAFRRGLGRVLLVRFGELLWGAGAGQQGGVGPERHPTLHLWVSARLEEKKWSKIATLVSSVSFNWILLVHWQNRRDEKCYRISTRFENGLLIFHELSGDHSKCFQIDTVNSYDIHIRFTENSPPQFAPPNSPQGEIRPI